MFASALRRTRRAAWLSLAAALACTPVSAQPQPQDDSRDLDMFRVWLAPHRAEVQAFEAFLAREKLANVVPTWQLLRSASMWKECKAPPFQLPPRALWREAGEVLTLLKELRRTGVLGPFAVVSAYRDPRLNRCAGGARRSSHLRFAVDILPLAPWDDQKLCAFWRNQGKRWDMGLSRYPSGRVHIDRTGWRTWGSDHTRKTSFCFQRAQQRP